MSVWRHGILEVVQCLFQQFGILQSLPVAVAVVDGVIHAPLFAVEISDD